MGDGQNGQEGFPDGKMAKLGIMQLLAAKLGMEDGISLFPVTEAATNKRHGKNGQKMFPDYKMAKMGMQLQVTKTSIVDEIFPLPHSG